MNIPYDSPILDSIIGALTHSKRRGIIHDLSLYPATVGQLARNHDLSLPAIHKHVRILEKSGLIVRKKTGRTNFVALQQDSLALVQAWLGQYRAQWGNKNASLENYIARMQE